LPLNKVTLHEIRILSKQLAVFSNPMFQWRSFSPAVRRHVAGLHKSWSVGRRGEQILYAVAQYLWLLSVQIVSCYLPVAVILKVLLDFCIPHMWSGSNITYVKSNKTTAVIIRSW